jgi:hypothetical protein
MPSLCDADKLRMRSKRMLELANRAHCEKNYDFARLLTQLAAEVLEHAKEMEEAPESRIGSRIVGQPTKDEDGRLS